MNRIIKQYAPKTNEQVVNECLADLLLAVTDENREIHFHLVRRMDDTIDVQMVTVPDA